MRKPCAAWAEKLAAIHPDDLSPSEYAELEAHIAECPTCAAIRTEYRLMDALILAFPSPESLFNLSPPPLKFWEAQNPDGDQSRRDTS